MEPDAVGKLPPAGAGGWGQYANFKNVPIFGSLKSPTADQKSFTSVADINVEHKEGMQSATKLQKSKSPRKPVWLGGASPGANVKCYEKHPSSFGMPSPPRNIFNKPLWVKTDVETVEITPTQRSLEDLYSENPDLKLEASVDSRTMHLAAEIIRQLVNEAVCRWLNNWCPHMDLAEVSEAIRVTAQGSGPSCKKYNVPLGAIDSSLVTTSIAEMYQQCQISIPTDADDIRFPHLFELIDQSVVFLRAIKDTRGVTKLQKTKSTIQWFPIGLDAKKLFVLKNANTELDKLNRKYSSGVGESDISVQRQIDELSILDGARVEFSAYCQSFEMEMLNELCGLLAWQGD
ncbi:hypothetical protein NPX13_g6484 [Xylaria arbuscula]|uniref:Uncharacterized protein n=1 Tax=Xylaria arbuscula TaxID=114810 RepID=A0A9W8NCE2_9PEZI|nr:hypothetical protein NPX13_g6484 [Xylaria arbuscula]